VVGRAHLEDSSTSVVLYAAAARVAIHRGDLGQAQQDLARAQQLRPQLNHALPYYAVQARLELVRAYIALTDMTGARTVLREIDDVLCRRPRLGTLPDQADQLLAQLDHVLADLTGASSLTSAELRLLTAGHLPILPRDGPATVHLTAHREVTSAVGLPQARRVLPQPGHPTGSHHRPARVLAGGTVAGAAPGVGEEVFPGSIIIVDV
jgi:hypothetical protein